MEIATYTSLIAAATRCGDAETRAACERILPQEQAMAQWLLEHVPSISTEYLDRSASGQEAKKRTSQEASKHECLPCGA
ncbi:DUF892 family protein [Caballeronia sp. ATUFL_M1_KS5A]|uniref:DUF892 family protein n=1 Tax=Caballeronia sp. ATUFL_M1_KS5A TaxID=2921778 RepID=UPI0020279C50|nr:DUF892 family protein [Caballeronia sp. ATUFL_M1_KS5A]